MSNCEKCKKPLTFVKVESSILKGFYQCETKNCINALMELINRG